MEIVYRELIQNFNIVIKDKNIINKNSGAWRGERRCCDEGSHYDIKSLSVIKDKDTEKINKSLNSLKQINTKFTISYKFQKNYISVNDINSENSSIHFVDLKDEYTGILLNFCSKKEIIDWLDLNKKVNQLEELTADYINSKNEQIEYSRIIFDKEISGLIISMIVGYFFEGDRVSSNTSYFFENINKLKLNYPLNIYDKLVDDFPVYFEYDNEGTKAFKEINLIKNGAVCSYLTDIDSAKKLLIENNGRSRAQDYRCVPTPRMTNVIVEPGNISFDKLLKKIENGIYCVGGGAAVDIASGIIHINCLIGYEFKNGEIGFNLIKNPCFSFEIFDFLNNITDICNQAEVGYRFMGKGRPIQNILIGFSSPEICLNLGRKLYE